MKIKCILSIILLIGGLPFSSYASDVNSIGCRVHSRDFDILEENKMLTASKSNDGQFQIYEFEGYKIKLGISRQGHQASLIVGHENVGVVQKILWQSLRQYKGMNIPHDHGFTGLMFFGGETEWPNNADQLPELQVRCWVN